MAKQTSSLHARLYHRNGRPVKWQGNDVYEFQNGRKLRITPTQLVHELDTSTWHDFFAGLRVARVAGDIIGLLVPYRNQVVVTHYNFEEVNLIDLIAELDKVAFAHAAAFLVALESTQEVFH